MLSPFSRPKPRRRRVVTVVVLVVAALGPMALFGDDDRGSSRVLSGAAQRPQTGDGGDGGADPSPPVAPAEPLPSPQPEPAGTGGVEDPEAPVTTPAPPPTSDPHVAAPETASGPHSVLVAVLRPEFDSGVDGQVSAQRTGPSLWQVTVALGRGVAGLEYNVLVQHRAADGGLSPADALCGFTAGGDGTGTCTATVEGADPPEQVSVMGFDPRSNGYRAVASGRLAIG